MLLKGLLSAAALAAGVTVSAGVVLDSADGVAGDDGTLAMAPFSLGNPVTAATGLTVSGPDDPMDVDGDTQTTPPVFQISLPVGPGDTLAGMLTGAGVDTQDAQAAISALIKVFNPRRIRRGQKIDVRFRAPVPGSPEANAPEPGKFIGLSIEPDYNTQLLVERADTGFKASKTEKQLISRPARAEGTIKSSLYVSGRKAGIPNRVLVELIRAYSWDVDFQRDIREGDTFEVMYDRIFDEQGDQVHSGNIRFAALTLSGKRHPIYLFTMRNGDSDYFDALGQSARKALMRTPIDGARLSSGFGSRRHPILGYNKMHRGVDFAASRGTPIYAAGNGIVVKSGRNGAYGNYVKIRHNSRYDTAYAHMKAINRSARKGMRVKQGQIIGYVGTTGRSTGPHLHYEILIAGRRTNPMKVKMPSGRKLKADMLEDFQVARTVIDSQYAALPPNAEVAEK